jgi:hypothetical protein
MGAAEGVWDERGDEVWLEDSVSDEIAMDVSLEMALIPCRNIIELLIVRFIFIRR